MTTREKLILMDDIRRKNDTTWSRYANYPRQRGTWQADVKKPFRPFDSIGSQCLLAVCVPVLLVLFVMIAG